jgi:hypothetical protein
MIPQFRPDGSLPAGVHDASWTEIVERFGGTPGRRELLQKLRRGLDNLRIAGVPWVLIDGSFVTLKPDPNDVDGCWEYNRGIDLVKLDSAFLLGSIADRHRLKERYGMDFFIAGIIEGGTGQPFSEFFQTGRDGRRKGIVRLDLTAEGQQDDSERP